MKHLMQNSSSGEKAHVKQIFDIVSTQIPIYKFMLLDMYMYN